MKSYSLDIRERVIYYRQQGESAESVSKLLRISKRSVERYWQRYTSEGTLESRRRGGYKQSVLTPFMSKIECWIDANPNMTLSELSQLCASKFRIKIKSTALWQQLDKHGLSFKKNDTRRRARQAGCQAKARSMEAKPAASRHKKTGVS